MRRCRGCSLRSFRAQRLSASLIIAGQPMLQERMDALWCSTPFGITDYCGRCEVCTPCTTNSSAQRLSASLIIAGSARWRPVPRAPCAQRLSASLIIAGSLGQRLQQRSIACSTPFGITDYCGSGSRRRTPRTSDCAQRLSASLIIAGANSIVTHSSGLLCSTPFGITDYCGGRPDALKVADSKCAQRLSASLIIAVEGLPHNAARPDS